MTAGTTTRLSATTAACVQQVHLVWFFGFEHDPTFDAGLPVKLNARIVL